jgi:hypothetical protein
MAAARRARSAQVIRLYGGQMTTDGEACAEQTEGRTGAQQRHSFGE